jgi:transposase-like protein
MSRKSKVKYEEKLSAVLSYRRGEMSQQMLANKYGVGKSSIQKWIILYESQGAEAIKPKAQNKRYSKELKEQAVQDYLKGVGSLWDICKKYKIDSHKQLQDWLRLYNGHKALRTTGGAGRGIYMTKGRKTTCEERIGITAFCIENGKDYALTIERYGVSYQQIYSWVKKYETNGVKGLSDRRGKAKPESEMTDADRLRAENKLLAAKNKDLEMELALLKKSRNWKGVVAERSQT